MKIKHYQPLTYIATGMASIAILAGMLLSNNMSGTRNASAASNVATATIKVNMTCSMTATVDVAHTASLINGIYSGDYTVDGDRPYANGIGKTTIQTFCNDGRGYAIYAIGYTGGDAGVTAGTNTVLHSNALGAEQDIITGTATNGLDNGDKSNWAMKVSSKPGTYAPTIGSDADGSFSNYHKVPASYTKVASYPSATDAGTGTGSSIETTYAAYISNTQAPGNYTGQVKYVLVHPNTAAPGDYIMQEVDEWGSTVSVGQEVTAYDIRDGKSYTVRRMCMEGAGDNCDVEGSMLWMTQNLDLDLDSSVALTSENTDLNEAGSGVYVDGYDNTDPSIIYWTPSRSTITSIDQTEGKFNDWISSSYISRGLIDSADPDAGHTSSPWYASDIYSPSGGIDMAPCNTTEACNYLKENNTIAVNYFQYQPFTSGFTANSHTKIGNYYNWTAAIASNNSTVANTSTYDDVSNNPQNSICPKGWRLPTVSSVAENDEFARLNNAYNSSHSEGRDDGLVKAPVYMVRSGFVVGYSGGSGGGILKEAWNSGSYWSSTLDGNPYYFTFKSNTNVVPSSHSYSKSYGRSVRCVSEY